MATGGSSRPESAAVPLASQADPELFPFRCELSLAPLITFWTQLSAYHELGRGPIPGLVRERARTAPELTTVIHDESLIEHHRAFVDLIMSALFPLAFWEQEYGAALYPFQLRAFYATPPFRRSLMGADGTLQGRANFLQENSAAETLAGARRMLAYQLILERIYGIEAGSDVPVIFTTAEAATGLDQHFRLQFDWRFVQVESVGSPLPLPEPVRQQLQTGVIDTERLLTVLPPDRFILRGFMIVKAVDVTDQEVLSSLKRDLIDKDSIVSSSRFQGLQAKLRTFFRRPELGLGLAAVEGDRVLVLNDASRHEQACIFADSAHHTTAEFAGSLYERAFVQGRPIVVEDLQAYPERTPVEDDLIRNGVRNVVCAPLHYQDKVIGTLELVSPRVGDLNATHLPRLEEVLPLFSMAVQRSVEELNSRIQTVINEQCTAIHPTVEWRFRRAVLNSFERHRDASGATELEPIVFEGVSPLYGLADIRGSSTQRAQAIQADLITQLRLAKAVVESAREARSLPALDELAYRIDHRTAQIERTLTSSDEVGIVAFLRGEVESLLDHLGTFGPGIRERITAYRQSLDVRLGTVYHRRRLFEESVTRIAESISSYLDLEEQAAQGMFPHYFEKQKTDGVDYQIYVGASLLEDRRADPLCLKNLRLWQLMVTCGLAVRAAELRDHLPVPLETTHLILVQHAPLSIRFRFDEKRFDVDGAYDIRYEIVKKRIDKAVVQGTAERVTQPGKIAIVYSQPAEALEYRRYIEYLQSLGYLTRDVQALELGELQGVQGLRALRVEVALDNPKLRKSLDLADLQVVSGR